MLADMGKIAPEESQVWQDSRQDWYQVLGEIKTRDAVEWLVEEDLRGQRVLATLVHDMGTKAAKETFRQVFFRRKTPHHRKGPRTNAWNGWSSGWQKG